MKAAKRRYTHHHSSARLVTGAMQDHIWALRNLGMLLADHDTLRKFAAGMATQDAIERARLGRSCDAVGPYVVDPQ